MRRGRLSLAGQAFVLQLVVLALVIGIGAVLAVFDARHDSDVTTTREVTDVAVSVAEAPSTIAAVRSPDPTALLQPVTERIRIETGMDFIVAMAPDRTRFTHTNPDRIGHPFTGTIDRALAGETFTETFTGTLGPSIRAVAPVRDDDGQVIALVSAGVTRAKIGDQVGTQLPVILGVTAAGLVVAAGGSFLLSRRLRRQTHGLAPDELRAMYEQHDAVLHSIHEGLVVFGRSDGRAEVVNDEARRLLGLPDRPIERGEMPVSLQQMRGVVRDEMHVTTDRVLLVNQDIVTWDRRPIGTVMTIRDHTELRAVLGELDSVRSLAESLRAHAHESANRLHTVVTMVELGRYQEAVEFATAELQLSQALIDRLLGAVGDPALAALLLGKVNQAAGRGVELSVTEDTGLDSTAPLSAHESVTLVGNLVDNAIDAAADGADSWVEVTVHQEDSALFVRVADSGPGMSPETLARAAERGYSTKADHQGVGLALVHRLVARHGGTIRTEAAPESAVTVTIPRKDGR